MYATTCELNMYTIYFLCNIFSKNIKQQKVFAISFIFTITFDKITVLSVILIQLEKNHFIKQLRKKHTSHLIFIFFVSKYHAILFTMSIFYLIFNIHSRK